MKKKLLLLLFLTTLANAQIVNIPDANFKAKLLSSSTSNMVAGNLNLNSYKIDVNSDNEIQVSEALLVGRIDVSNSNITDLTGVEEFVNLKHLICNNNQLSSLNLSVFTNLTKLDCGNNQLTSLDISGLSNLEQVHCKSNLLTSLDASGFVNLSILDCALNQINNLNVSGLVNLSFMDCKGNQLSNLDLSGLTSLDMLYCGVNQFSSLDVSELVDLDELYCNSNELSTLDLVGLNNLKKLDISNNLFSDINLEGLNLIQLTCNNNLLTSLDLSGLTDLEALHCFNNQLQTLDVNDLPNLGMIRCQNNNLSSLFIKNGIDEFFLIFSNNPNLQFICADESQISSVQAKLDDLGMTATVSNAYCSFIPGGDYNIISGAMIFDANTNGCDVNDLPQPNIKININDGTTLGANFTNNSGIYSFYPMTGSFNLTPDVENPSWFNFSPTSATIPFANNDNNVVTQNFCITANGVHRDLEIVIIPIIPARPGFDAVYKIVYKNKGNQTVTGFVNFTFNDAVLDFVSSSVVPSSISAGYMNWAVPNIAPFQSGSMVVTFNVNSPQETPAVNIGDVLAFNTFIDVTTDDVWADNNFDFNQTVVGSYDPNDITCLEGNSLPTTDIGAYLHYNIRFENTGTAPAENIVVENQIDLTQYNVQSLQVMESSHPVMVKVTGNIAEFIFQGIDLDTGGHGNILLKLKSNTTLPSNEVMSSANIFFDYNFPIETNDSNTVFEDLVIEEYLKDNSIAVYPNPTHNVVNIEASSVINSVQVYDIQGRLLLTHLSSDMKTSIDIADKADGIYFFKINSDKGIKVEKIIKK